MNEFKTSHSNTYNNNYNIHRRKTIRKFIDTPTNERLDLFKEKLILCCEIYDFSDPKKDIKGKEIKKDNLLELTEFISNNSKIILGQEIGKSILNCVIMNISRPIKSKKNRIKKSEDGITDVPVDEDEPMLDESWPHLQLIYELLLRFIISKDVDSKTAKEYFSKNFLILLLNLFGSEDPRERDYLKTILHRIYGKSMALRSFIRRSINDLFYTFVYETESFHGIGELLEILGSIINGFALPLKQEHQHFLEKAIIPLHKVSSLGTYHQQLAYCTTQFIEKDPKTVEPIIFGLLKYWPSAHSQKEILFLNEIEEILEIIKPEHFSNIMQPLFRQIGKCMGSPHFQVSQRALYIWNNETIVNLVAVHRIEILPLIFKPLYKNCESHWHAAVQSLTYNVLKLFMEMDSQLFDQCSVQYQEEEARDKIENDRRTNRWMTIESKLSGVNNKKKM